MCSVVVFKTLNKMQTLLSKLGDKWVVFFVGDYVSVVDQAYFDRIAIDVRNGMDLQMLIDHVGVDIRNGMGLQMLLSIK